MKYYFVGYDDIGRVRIKSLPRYSSLKAATRAAERYMTSSEYGRYVASLKVMVKKTRRNPDGTTPTPTVAASAAVAPASSVTNPCGGRRRNPAEFLSYVDTRYKKVYEYAVQGNYGSRWEDVTYEDTLSEARQRLREYNENEPYPHRIVKRRVN
jgi:hypothetical protein